MNGASVEAQRYAENIKNGTGSAQTFATNQKAIQTSMNGTSVASKAAAVGINLFKAALNTLIFFAVIEGIQLLVKGIDNLILTAEEAEEKAESLRNSMQSFFDEVQSGQQTISSISDRFSELSKHVTETGENIDLTKDEYSEYLDICNQVKSIMPELVSGYTNEGNAIITLKDNVDSLTESYKENIRAKAAAFVTNGDDDGNTIQSFFDDYKIFTEGEGGLFAPRASGLWNNKSTDYEDYYGYDRVHEWLSEVADLSLKDLQNLQKGTTQATYLYALLKENGYELANITEDNYEAVHDVLDTRLTSLEGEMATRVSNVKMSLQQMLYADRDYWDIDNKEALSTIDSLFSSVDAEFIKQNNLLGQTALQSFESNVIRLFEDKNTQQSMIDIYAPQGTEESIEDYSKRVNNAIKNVQDYAKENKIDISLDFGDITGDVETLQKQYDDAIAKAKKQESDFDWNSWFKENSINTQEEIDRWNKIAESATNAADARKKYTEGEEGNETLSLDSAKESVTGLAEEYTLLQEILKDTANVSEETYTKLIACSSKYSAALKTESGRLVVNKNKLLAVAKSRSKDQKETIKQAVAQKKLEYLKQAKYLKVYDNQLIDTTSDTYDNINAIQEEITQYQLLAEQLDSATSAFERFKEAQQTDNTPQNDTANDAFKTIKEGLESGQVGTDDFRTAQELLMGAKEYQEFLELGNSAENPLEKQYLYMEKWQNKTKQFFGEDMKQNVINFLDALDATGLLQDGMLASSSKIGEELGLSLDSVNALVEGVNTFGFKDIIQQSQIDFVDEYAERIQNLNDTKEAYYKAEESRDGKENNNYIEGLKQDWQDEQTAYDQFMQSLPNRYADIVSAFESSGTDKSFADYFTDAIGGNENALAFTEAVGDGISYINDKISDLNHQGIFSSEEIDNLNTVKDNLTEMRQQLSKSTNTFLKDSDAQKYVDLLAKKKKLEGTEKTSSNAKQIASELSDVQSQLDSLEKPTVIELQLNKSAVDAQIAEVESQIKRLDSLTAKID